MIEKIRTVSNPLTVIAIFAGLSEVAGSTVLGFVDRSVQPTFIWYVMLFPVLLVVLFFATLIFKADVLYAPSDFANEENYMALRAARQSAARQMAEEVQTVKELLTSEIESATHSANEAPSVTDSARDSDREDKMKVALESLDKIQASAEVLEKEFETSTMGLSQARNGNLELRILRRYLERADEPRTISQMAYDLKFAPKEIHRALALLFPRVITSRDPDGRVSFSLRSEPRAD